MMEWGAKATHLSRGLQVVADEVLLGGGWAVEQGPSQPAHAQEQVWEAQVEKWAHLEKGKSQQVWVESQPSHPQLQFYLLIRHKDI